MKKQWMALLFIFSLGLVPQGLAQAKVSLENVKYDDLKEAILRNRGKVVYLDFWFLTCDPCRKAMPHLVDFHAKHQKEGLVVMTVNVNVHELPEVQHHKDSLDFLRKINASFRNVILDEGEEIWSDKLQLKSFPTVIVFDRKGFWTRFDGKFHHEEVERFVEKLLREPLSK